MYVLSKFTIYFRSIVSITIESSLHIFHLYDHSASTKSFSMVFCMIQLDTSSLYSLWYLCNIWYIYVNMSPFYLLTQQLSDKYPLTISLSFLYSELISGNLSRCPLFHCQAYYLVNNGAFSYISNHQCDKIKL